MAAPILVTGAAGEVGGIGRTLTQLLLERGHAVRALVRREDERAEALRALGAEVVQGDLLDLHAMHRAIEGCERVYFGMSVSPSYLEATVNVAAVALHHRVQAFVNMSQMTVTQMGITDTTPSPQHKQHWLAEQALDWSGLPVVHVRPTVFLEGFFLRFAAPGIRRANELALPMGLGRTSPISAGDVARVVAEILHQPAPHIGQIYNLTGPQVGDLHFFAGEYSEALDRRISYRDVDPQAWREQLQQWKLPTHLLEHVTAMAQLNREGRYDRMTDDVQRLTGTPAISLREFVRGHAEEFSARESLRS
ncbi:MAG TPA: NAD(P)H-binding protein [Ramlibacter sp.]|nr:NAD(P)H-binding protein [Ramlibacter sp.]